jgi:hypothetical protein
MGTIAVNTLDIGSKEEDNSETKSKISEGVSKRQHIFQYRRSSAIKNTKKQFSLQIITVLQTINQVLTKNV